MYNSFYFTWWVSCEKVAGGIKMQVFTYVTFANWFNRVFKLTSTDSTVLTTVRAYKGTWYIFRNLPVGRNPHFLKCGTSSSLTNSTSSAILSQCHTQSISFTFFVWSRREEGLGRVGKNAFFPPMKAKRRSFTRSI